MFVLIQIGMYIPNVHVVSDLLLFGSRLVVLPAGALKLVSHPNVVRLEAVHEDPRSIAIVMTLCRGGDLWDKVGVSCFLFSFRVSLDGRAGDQPFQAVVGLPLL